MMQPGTPTQSPNARRWYNDPDLFWHGFLRSNYVTAFTDWFMGPAGKLAEFALYATVLYSGAELYPGVTLPTGLNLSVFLLQMGALDIGGIGLSKLAKQARDDGNPEGAEKAERLSTWLIRIMIAGMVTVSTEQVIAHLPGIQAIQSVIQIVQALVELVLVVTRAICAVLYGKVVHALKRSAPEQQQPDEQNHLITELHTQFAHVQQDNQNLSAHLHTVNLQVANLAAKLETAQMQITDLQRGVPAPAQKPSAPSAPSQSTQKITSIDQARAKHHATQGKAQRISHAEVLTYIATHPGLKRAEVAAHLGISERKVYDALAWQKEREVAAHS